MQVIAHRGNNKESLENSATAYEKSVECGAKRIELDVMLTSDRHAVINHDDFLFHTTGLNAYCSQMTRKELSTICLRNGEPILFLDQVVERFLSKIELNIEIKGNNPESAKAVCKIIANHPLREKIIVSDFNPEPLKYMRDHAPDIRRACLTGDDELPWPFFSHLSILNFMRDVSADIVHPRMGQISEAFMDQCKSRSWKVYTWAPMIGEDVSREAWWTMLKTYEVDGHCTNYPREMIAWLKHENEFQTKAQLLLNSDSLVGVQNAF